MKILKQKKADSRPDLNNIKKITGFAKSKRSQHEMVGFILIVIIVVIIGLFLLVFYLRQEPVSQENLDVQNFLQASMAYTTDCAINWEPNYLELQDLIKAGYKNQQCLNGKMASKELNETLNQILKESLMASQEIPVKYYSLFIYYEQSDSAIKEEILKLQAGNCSGSRTGAQHFLHYPPGNIIISLEICYV